MEVITVNQQGFSPLEIIDNVTFLEILYDEGEFTEAVYVDKESIPALIEALQKHLKK